MRKTDKYATPIIQPFILTFSKLEFSFTIHLNNSWYKNLIEFHFLGLEWRPRLGHRVLLIHSFYILVICSLVTITKWIYYASYHLAETRVFPILRELSRECSTSPSNHNFPPPSPWACSLDGRWQPIVVRRTTNEESRPDELPIPAMIALHPNHKGTSSTLFLDCTNLPSRN